MSKRLEIYKCCGGMLVEILHGDCCEVACRDMTCCGEPMVLQKANTVDAAKEKHVPVLEEYGSGVLVKVGSAPHPMTAEHHIEWVEIINGDYVNRKYLNPGEAPEAAFYVEKQPGLAVRAYCNLHGLWECKI